MKPLELDSSAARTAAAHHAPYGVPVFLGILAMGAVAGCNGGSGPNDTGGGSGSGNAPGSVVDQPDPSIGSLHFVVDANSGGFASHPRVLGLKWGRLANVYDASGTLQQRDMVVGPDIPSVDSVTFTLTVNPVTDETIVTINETYGTAAYLAAFSRLDANLVPIVDKSLDPNELPPYSVAPRNSALILQFDDLLDASTIQAATVKLLTGNPPTVPLDVRVIPDINHGDTADFTHRDPFTGNQVPGGDGIPEFHTTRVILDTTVSELEAAASNPPLPQNALGLPASPTPNLPNIGVRIPTIQDVALGQLAIVRNASGRGVSFTGSGPTDPASPTDDIVRALRSGNNSDQNHGFLFDDIAPEIIGTQAVGLGSITPETGGFRTSVTFTVLPCKNKLRVGDVLQQPGVFAQVLVTSPDPDLNGVVSEVHYKIVFPPNGTLTPGPAQLAAPFNQSDNFGQQACFLRLPGAATPPATDVATDSAVILRFSEPMDPVTIKPFDTFTVTRVPDAPAADQYIVGEVTPSADLRRFTFTPVLPLTHDAGTEETYYVTVSSEANGPTDLAGNQVISSGFLPQVPFTIDQSENPQDTAGFALRFSASDELNETGVPDGPELRGQFLRDIAAGVLRPRTVQRFSAAATREKPVPSAMRIPPAGVQTPLSPLGSKLHAIWRYCDVGLGLTDETFYNIDVEGLAWAPIGGSVVSDDYANFSIYLSHSVKLPDESVNTGTLLPDFRNSGLVSTYSQNVLVDPADNPQVLVHPKVRGYVVDPSARFLSTTTPAVTMMPFPLNQNLPINQHVFYTWRDTTLRAIGGANNAGAELKIVTTVTGIGTTGQPYSTGTVPTVGLPLLMEFRCYPDLQASGLNSFDINIAINSSSLPNFRAFSTGGTNSSGQQVTKDPDQESVATGGFNPSSVPPGATTTPVDNVVYIGQMDLVVRVSRAHSIFFNTDSTSGSPVYSAPVVEPRISDQPAGTDIALAFRGATNVTGDATRDATRLDAYGEPVIGGGTVTFVNGDSSWKSELEDIHGASYFQVRISFISNAATLLTPQLSALGFAFFR